jgi:DHA2 family multidrug resistance protein
MYQVSGMAFIFIPISVLSYVGIPPEKNNQVSGISNFVRNLGGSVGISMLTTFLARQNQVHQTALVANATAANPQFRAMMSSGGGNGSGAGSATQHAYGQVMGLIQQQAAVLSYVNAFWVVSVVVACLIPLPFLLKRPRAGEASSAGMH